MIDDRSPSARDVARLGGSIEIDVRVDEQLKVPAPIRVATVTTSQRVLIFQGTNAPRRTAAQIND